MNYAIEYDGQNFLKFVSKLLDISIWRIWQVAGADFGFCETRDMPGQLEFQVYERLVNKAFSYSSFLKDVGFFIT